MVARRKELMTIGVVPVGGTVAAPGRLWKIP